MEWIHTFTIIGVVGGFFLYMMNRMDANRNHTDEKFEEMNHKFEVIDKRFNGLENRMTSLETATKAEFKALNQRIDSTNQRIESTNQRITDLRTDFNQRLSTIESYLVFHKVVGFEKHEYKEQTKQN